MVYRLKKQLKDKFQSKEAKNFIWLASDKLLKVILNICIMTLIAKVYGPSDFGMLSYCLALTAIVVSVTSMGNDSFIIKEILTETNNKNEILGSAFFLRVLCCCIFSIILYFNVLYFSHDNETKRLFNILIFLVISAPFDLIDVEYQSNLSSRNAVIPRNIAAILVFCIRLILLSAKCSLTFFAFSYIIESLVTVIFIIIVYQKRTNKFFNWSINDVWTRLIFKKSFPLLLSSLSVVLYMRLDQIMLGSLSSSKEVGLFSIVNRIGESLYFLPIAFANSSLPSLAQIRGNKALLNEKVIGYLKKMLALSIGLAIFTAVTGHLAIIYVLGKAYEEALRILYIYSWCIIPVSVGLVSNQYIILNNSEKIIFYRTLLGLALNVSLNYFLIPKYGATGAAIATFSSYVFIVYITNIFFKTSRQLLTLQMKSIFFLLRN